MELFNMKTDPKELHNLAKEPSQQNRLKEIHAVLVKQLGEDPEQSELRFRNGAVPDNPNPSK